MWANHIGESAPHGSGTTLRYVPLALPHLYSPPSKYTSSRVMPERGAGARPMSFATVMLLRPLCLFEKGAKQSFVVSRRVGSVGRAGSRIKGQI